MKMTSYLKLCVVLSAVVFLSVVFIPGVGQAIEGPVLGFLSTNAR